MPSLTHASSGSGLIVFYISVALWCQYVTVGFNDSANGGTKHQEMVDKVKVKPGPTPPDKTEVGFLVWSQSWFPGHTMSVVLHVSDLFFKI